MRPLSLLLVALLLILATHSLGRAEEPKTAGAQTQKWEYRLIVYEPGLHEEDEDAAFGRRRITDAGWSLVPKGQNVAGALKAAGEEGWELLYYDSFSSLVLKRPKR